MALEQQNEEVKSPGGSHAAPRKPRRTRIRRPLSTRVVPALAMLFIGGMAIATSLPAAAVGPGSQLGAANLSHAQDLGEQSLLVGDMTAASLARDGYSVLRAPAPALTASVGGYNCSVDAPAETSRTTWPYDHPVKIGDGFGPRAEGFHKGVDMLAGAGTPVQSIADGAVFATGDGGTGGVFVGISHTIGGQRICSMYMHFVEGSLAVSVGQIVTAGQFLGLTGRTGNATVEHTHFELYYSDNVRFDPLPWLNAHASY